MTFESSMCIYVLCLQSAHRSNKDVFLMGSDNISSLLEIMALLGGHELLFTKWDQNLKMPSVGG